MLNKKLFALIVLFFTISAAPLSAQQAASVGTRLMTSNGTWNNCQSCTYTYQWNWASGHNPLGQIPGANAQTYTPTSNDIGATLTATVTAHNVIGNTSAIAMATGPVVACYGIHNPANTGFDPNAPQLSGYNLVFDSEFNNLNDMSNTCTNPTDHSDAGCNGGETNWYPSNWSFPGTTTDVTSDGVDIDIEAPPFPSNKTTVLHMHPAKGTGGWALSTMGVFGGASHGPANWQQGWHGHVFTGGWYVEARTSTDAQTGFIPGHFTVWSYAIDRKITNTCNWAEDDYLDGLTGNNSYLTGLLDWQAPTGTCTGGSGNVDVSSNDGCINGSNHNININCGGFPNNFQDKTHAHIYAQLWVPATNTTQGFLQEFFDGVSMGFYRFNKCGGVPCARDGSVIDLSHMQVNFGNDNNGDGSSSWWDWVHVWQLPAAQTTSGNATITPQPNFAGGNGSCSPNK